MAFRINCRAFLLTYQNSSGNLDFASLRRFFENEECVAFSICEEEANRRHFHVYVEYAEKIDRLASFYAVNGENPGDVQTNGATRNFRQQTLQGHFYVYNQFKESHIQSFTTCKQTPPCKVITDMVKEGKMKIENAVKCAAFYKMHHGLDNMMRDLNRLEAIIKQTRLQEAIAEAKQSANSVIQRPWRAYPQFAAFLDQFKYTQARYKFCIIVGPTQLGKSQFAKHAFRNPKIFVQSTAWRDYDYFEHDAIIFDDVTRFDSSEQCSNIFQYIIRHKALFQAGADVVRMGKSATSIYEFDVLVYRKPIVVCCNYEHFESRDDSWIDQNAYILRVNEPMWL